MLSSTSIAFSLLFLYAVVPIGVILLAKRRRHLRWWWPLIPVLSYVLTPVWLLLWVVMLPDLVLAMDDRTVGDTVIPGSSLIYWLTMALIVTTPTILTAIAGRSLSRRLPT